MCIQTRCDGRKETLLIEPHLTCLSFLLTADGESVNTKGAVESGQKPKSVERSGLGDMNDIADAQYLYTSITTDEQGEPFSSGNSQETRHLIVSHRLVPPGKRSGCISAGK